MSSIKEQVLAQQQGQYSEADDKYLSVLKQYNCNLNDEEIAAEVKKTSRREGSRKRDHGGEEIPLRKH